MKINPDTVNSNYVNTLMRRALILNIKVKNLLMVVNKDKSFDTSF